MAEQSDYTGLEWLEGEVRTTLAEARQNLELYRGSDGDSRHLNQCQKQLQQVVSTMKIMEQHGAQLLCSEMQKLLFSMLSMPVTEARSHIAILMKGLKLLPDYLQQVSLSGYERPEQLKPILRNMRQVRGQSPLKDLDFFAPDINTPSDPLLPEQLDKLRNDNFVPLLRKIRQIYQRCLTSIIQKQHTDKELESISKLFAKLQNLCWGAPLAPLWDAASALIEGVKEGSITLDSDVAYLLREIDHQLKMLETSDVEGLNEKPSKQMLRHLLYRIALADSQQPLITSLNYRYNLDQALLSAQGDPGFESDAGEDLRTEKQLPVIREARESLAKLQEVVVDFLGNTFHKEHLHKIPPLMQAIHTCLSSINLDRAAQQIERCQQQVEQHWLPRIQPPGLDELEALADFISHIHQYLESTDKKEPTSESEKYLNMSEPNLKYLSSVTLKEVSQKVNALEIESKNQIESNSADDRAPELIIPAQQTPTPNSSTQQRIELQGEQKPPTELESFSDSDERKQEGPVSSLDIVETPSQTDSQEYPQVLEALEEPKESTTSLIHTKEASNEAPMQPHGRQTTTIEVPEGNDQAETSNTFIIDDVSQKPDIKEAFIQGATAITEQLLLDLQTWHQLPGALESVIQAIHQGFQQLKETGRTAQADVIGELASSIESMLGQLLSGKIKPSDPLQTLLKDVLQSMPDLVQDFSQDNLAFTPEVVVYLEQADALGKGNVFVTDEGDVLDDDAADETLEESSNDHSFTVEASPQALSHKPQQQNPISRLLISDLNKLLNAEQHLKQWQEGISHIELNQFKTELITLADAAHQIQMTPITNLCDVLLDICIYLDQQASALPQILLQPLTNGFEALVDMMNQVAASQIPLSPEPIFHELRNALLSLHSQPAYTPTGSEAPDEAQEINAVSSLDITAEPDNRSEATSTPPQQPLRPMADSDVHKQPADQNLLSLFLEEGFDHLEQATITLEHWLQSPQNLNHVQELQRGLHTLKGGARMAELNDMAELCHVIEDIYQAITTHQCPPEQAPIALIQQAYDTLEGILKAVSQGKPQPSVELLIQQIRHWAPKPPLEESQSTVALPDYLNTPPKSVISENRLSPSQVEKAKPSDDTVAVSSQALDNLVKLADEANMSRTCVEQQLSDSSQLLDEMLTTTARIQDLLGRLNLEQQQPDQSTSDTSTSHPEFSQLSRSLRESVTDLAGLRDLLQQNAKEAKRLLLQQTRTQAALQEQLMEIRMESFNRLVPRLRKVVRQVSEELGKPVDLDITNTQDLIDRKVLKHLQGPLEHMLRNAISHGIEDSTQTRTASGKPETGKVSLSLQQDGAELLIEITDDGRGIDINNIKERAIEQKLITEDTSINDQQAMELILQPGFSTAGSLSQISGRGLGLDVANREIRRLGGNLSIDSEKGVGCCFSLRLPLTESIHQMLMVEVGNHTYAVPLRAIDSLSMVAPKQLLHCYQNNTPLPCKGDKYQLIYLGSMLEHQQPKPLGDKCPVILVKRGEKRLAFHIDALIGTRELVTQRLGTQFAGLEGIHGASILGDGRVVIMIDPVGLYRRFNRQGKTQQQPKVTIHQRATRVLVVDDSVTVRKVTSRLLSRQGYEVESARDGVEAITQLQALKPDIVLLDIEMPRMDGFEVAKAIRSDAQMKDLPIIMITSRTGEKHRSRAVNLGINDYIGKPFQEEPLLDAIQRLVVTT